jgi:poly(A)-specific ribonuclease
MDIDKSNFPTQLLDILEAIAGAHFVAIDCEFTGVAKGIRPQGGWIKQSLQERYDESRKAAARYQIIQIGLTCAEEVLPGEQYRLRTYNFNINPILNEELDVERVFSFQSSAVEFLLRNNFSFDLPLHNGVQYLSRVEEAEAIQKANERLDFRNRFEDIQLTERDVDALDFITKVRGEIDDWVQSKVVFPRTITIGSKTKHWRDLNPGDADLSPFERRLVHQLVRADYPQLTTISRADAVAVTYFDKHRDDRHKRLQTKRASRKITSHVGFRWIIEALLGGNIGDIEAEPLILDFLGTAIEFGPDKAEVEKRLSRVMDKLAVRRPVLVGHNVFVDLIFIYQNFLQDLPGQVGQLQEIVHGDFPLIVDTKYMATHNCGVLNPASSLEQLDEMLSSQSKPAIGESI